MENNNDNKPSWLDFEKSLPEIDPELAKRAQQDRTIFNSIFKLQRDYATTMVRCAGSPNPEESAAISKRHGLTEIIYDCKTGKPLTPENLGIDQCKILSSTFTVADRDEQIARTAIALFIQLDQGKARRITYAKW